MSKKIPVTDADLHAYIDGQLSAERRIIVKHWLSEHPHELEKLKQYKSISNSLKKQYNPILSEPVPEHLYQLTKQFKQKPELPRQKYNIALAFSLFFTGLCVGWFVKANYHSQLDQVDQALVMHLVKPAAFAHKIYATDTIKPVEYKAVQTSELTHWLSDRMRTTIRPPNLHEHDFKLIGGRLIPSTNRMAAQFMYQNSTGKRITLYVRRINSLHLHNFSKNIQHASNSGVTTLFWQRGEMGYALSGKLDDKSLNELANAVLKHKIAL